MRILSGLEYGRPSDGRIPGENAVYDKLDELGIRYDRVDHEHADTMEDCLKIEAVLGAGICKNLFLCNRQQTDFYLLMMPGDKPFKTKYLSGQLGIARLSFGGPEQLAEYLNTTPGSVSALELIFDVHNRVQLVIDRDLMSDEHICAHPCISTSTLKLTTGDMLQYVRASGHEPVFVSLPDPRKEVPSDE